MGPGLVVCVGVAKVLIDLGGGGAGNSGSAGRPHPAISAATITITGRTARL
jgi:hypothetical protein